ncbi:MAG: hypothetical protein ABI633_03190 [Burkholderiales bacterium]
MNEANVPIVQAPEQFVYARLLERGTRLGLVILVLSFVAHVMGWVPPQVPLEQLPALWSHPVEVFLAETGSPTGWRWVLLIYRSDVASMAGIVVLGGVSIVCLAALVPIYRRRGERAFAALCIAELLVILIAASGLLSVGS